MLEKIQGVPGRIASLKAKLKAREGKKEFKQNREAIRAEIARLESVTANKAELAEFIESEGREAVTPVAASGLVDRSMTDADG